MFKPEPHWQVGTEIVIGVRQRRADELYGSLTDYPGVTAYALLRPIPHVVPRPPTHQLKQIYLIVDVVRPAFNTDHSGNIDWIVDNVRFKDNRSLVVWSLGHKKAAFRLHLTA